MCLAATFPKVSSLPTNLENELNNATLTASFNALLPKTSMNNCGSTRFVSNTANVDAGSVADIKLPKVNNSANVGALNDPVKFALHAACDVNAMNIALAVAPTHENNNIGPELNMMGSRNTKKNIVRSKDNTSFIGASLLSSLLLFEDDEVLLLSINICNIEPNIMPTINTIPASRNIDDILGFARSHF